MINDQDGKVIPETLVINIEKGINLALSATNRLGSTVGQVASSEVNLAMVASEFDVRVLPRGDVGYVGGGKAGEGPTLGGGVEINKKFQTGTRFSVLPTIMKAANNYQANFKTILSQPLLRGFGSEYTRSPLFAARYANRSAHRALYLAQIRIIMQTIQSLYEIKKQEHLVTLETDSMQRIKKFCASTKIKEKIGLCDALDVYRAEIELKHAEDSLDQAVDRLLDAKDILRDTLNLSMDQPIEVNVPIEYDKVDISLDEAIDIALKTRIEIAQLEDQVQENRRLQNHANKNLWPELNLVIDYTSFSCDEVFTRAWSNKRESKWGVGFVTSTDLNMVREKASYQQSLIATQDAERNFDRVRDNIILEVKRTLRNLTRAAEKIALQEEQVFNAQKEFRLALIKFQHGRANNFDTIQAEKNIRTAQNALISAVVDHKVGEFRLLAVIGMLADRPSECL